MMAALMSLRGGEVWTGELGAEVRQVKLDIGI